jgi:hypothetical protein
MDGKWLPHSNSELGKKVRLLWDELKRSDDNHHAAESRQVSAEEVVIRDAQALVDSLGKNWVLKEELG